MSITSKVADGLVSLLSSEKHLGMLESVRVALRYECSVRAGVLKVASGVLWTELTPSLSKSLSWDADELRECGVLNDVCSHIDLRLLASSVSDGVLSTVSKGSASKSRVMSLSSSGGEFFDESRSPSGVSAQSVAGDSDSVSS